MGMLDDLLAEDQASGDFDPNSLLGALMKRQLPAGHPSGMLMWIRDQIPQVQADDTSTMSGITSRLGRTATAIPRAGLETMANWLRGTHDPNAVRIGEDTIAPLGLAPMGMLLSPKNAVGILGGKLAQTADRNALAKAEQMAASGASREDIWRDTGWFQGGDGKWRFEIDDTPLKAGVGEGRGFSEGAITHPGLAAAYPENNVLTSSSRAIPGMAQGFYNDGRGFRSPTIHVEAATEGGRRKLAAHEGQHAVQDIEGFSPGMSDIYGQNYWKAPGEVEARAVEKRLPLSAEERRARPPWLDYAMADNAKSSVPGTVVNAMGEAGARTPRTIGDELLAMGTDQSKFMSTLDSLKLTKAEWDDLANHFTNAPSNGQYRYKFKNIDEAKKKIRDVFIERYEAKSKREIINRMTKWSGEDSAQASPLASAPGLAANATQEGPTEPMLLDLLRRYGMEM